MKEYEKTKNISEKMEQSTLLEFELTAQGQELLLKRVNNTGNHRNKNRGTEYDCVPYKSLYLSLCLNLFLQSPANPLALDMTKEAKGMACFIVCLEKSLTVSASRSFPMKFFSKGSLSSFSSMPCNT